MPLDAKQLEDLIERCIRDFYGRRLGGLENLRLKDVLKKKNPYLYRAWGVEKAAEMVEGIMSARLSSSDETKFGNAFFEPIAKMAANGVVAASEGGDVAIEFPNRYLALAVKSGPNWGNADQHKRQSQNFDALRRRLHKIQKQFDPLVGHGYRRQRGASTDD